jgi:hypothetical protein
LISPDGQDLDPFVDYLRLTPCSTKGCVAIFARAAFSGQFRADSRRPNALRGTNSTVGIALVYLITSRMLAGSDHNTLCIAHGKQIYCRKLTTAEN